MRLAQLDGELERGRGALERIRREHWSAFVRDRATWALHHRKHPTNISFRPHEEFEETLARERASGDATATPSSSIAHGLQVCDGGYAANESEVVFVAGIERADRTPDESVRRLMAELLPDERVTFSMDEGRGWLVATSGGSGRGSVLRLQRDGECLSADLVAELPGAPREVVAQGGEILARTSEGAVGVSTTGDLRGGNM